MTTLSFWSQTSQCLRCLKLVSAISEPFNGDLLWAEAEHITFEHYDDGYNTPLGHYFPPLVSKGD